MIQGIQRKSTKLVIDNNYCWPNSLDIRVFTFIIVVQVVGGRRSLRGGGGAKPISCHQQQRMRMAKETAKHGEVTCMQHFHWLLLIISCSRSSLITFSYIYMYGIRSRVRATNPIAEATALDDVADFPNLLFFMIL